MFVLISMETMIHNKQFANQCILKLTETNINTNKLNKQEIKGKILVSCFYI